MSLATAQADLTCPDGYRYLVQIPVSECPTPEAAVAKAAKTFGKEADKLKLAETVWRPGSGWGGRWRSKTYRVWRVYVRAEVSRESIDMAVEHSRLANIAGQEWTCSCRDCVKTRRFCRELEAEQER